MSPKHALQTFCEHFAAKNAAAVAEIFENAGLFEFPFASQRLIGRREIENGMQRMFDGLRTVSITMRKSKAFGNLTIAEGELKAARASSSDEMSIPLAIVVEESAGGISRLSAYYDTYGQRPWLDRAVFSAG